MDPTSDYYQFEPDYTIIFHSTHKLLEKHSLVNSDLQNKLADDRLDFVRLLCEQGIGRVIYYRRYYLGKLCYKGSEFVHISVNQAQL